MYIFKREATGTETRFYQKWILNLVESENGRMLKHIGGIAAARTTKAHFSPSLPLCIQQERIKTGFINAYM